MKLKSAISSTLTFIMCMLRFIEGVENKPNIIFILADDLGWNDVGFHGSSEIPTPNIDSLAYSGIILNNYYVNPICTPSRSALMTGKYPIHTGMQHDVLLGEEPRGLPLTEILLPQYLKKLGYRNHIVGKWHLGFYKKEYTPTFRGFDSHLGYWTGHQDYYDHTAAETHVWGLDMRKNMDVVEDLHGQYSTDVFTKEAIRLIRNQNKSQPLYLHVAHAAVHSANEYNPLPAPDDYVAKFAYIKDYKRQRFAGMLTKLDESVGEIVVALKDKGMLENSIIIFSTDNGGPAAGFNYNAASNFPLRGVKNTLWEGGLRGVGFLWSPHLKFSSRVAKQRMHITDWLPTLMEAVHGNFSKLGLIDGISMWKSLSENVESERLDILHDIDDIRGRASVTVGNWKYIKGTSYNGDWDGWYGPSGREYKYNFTLIAHSPAYLALKSIGKSVTFGKMKELRLQSTLTCNRTEVMKCKPAESPCLFNLEIDPCESNNLAATYPNILKTIEAILLRYNKTAIPPGNLPLDLRGNPRYWNYVWTNFGDYL